ncbi:DNA polymerase Y family protein [Nocardioides montaniterrae]
MARVLVVWCPDWSVTAALAEAADGFDTSSLVPRSDYSTNDLSSRAPAVVLHGNIVQVCNQAARDEGVRRGLRRRDAQSRCPEVVLLKADPDRDARWFEPVLGVVEDLRPGVAPIRPGLMAVSAAGRFGAGATGSEESTVALLAEHLVAAGVWDCRFGVADDLYTAERAARGAPVQGCVVVAPGESAEFLRGLAITVLADDGEEGREVADLLRRLGLTRLGEFAAFGPDEVSNRFGAYGTDLWRRVHGRGRSLVAGREPPPELACEVSFEPPLESAEAVTFSVRTTAEKFVAGLADRQLVATGVRIEAEFEGEGGLSARTWLHPRCFTSRDLVDRVHWQLQAGMATSGLRSRKSAGAITAPVGLVRFLPETVEPSSDHADGLWGGGAEEQVLRGVARVQAMVGYDAVRVPVLQGGRGAADRQALMPWGTRPAGLRRTDEPWPGAIPGPAPSRVFATPVEAEVLDAHGQEVGVTERGVVTGAPARLRVGSGPRAVWSMLAGWAGPWPVEERWWLDASAARSVRFQLVGVDGRAWLARLAEAGWVVEAAYE